MSMKPVPRRNIVEQVQATGDRGPAELYREQHDQQQAPPEDRHGVAGEGDAHHSVVDDGPAPERGDDTGQHAEHGGEQHGRHCQFEGGGEQGGEFVPDADTAAQGFAEVAVGEVADVVEILLVQGLVEAQAVHGFGVHLRIDAAFAHHDFHRIAGNQADQGEGQQGDAEERRDQQPEATGDEGEHRRGYLLLRLIRTAWVRARPRFLGKSLLESCV
ncbi:hypothetical protein Q3H58_001683 [Pseudomonas psychrotolerans]|nr:hypothetical protein [Pseudomonas psychrotolerans]